MSARLSFTLAATAVVAAVGGLYAWTSILSRSSCSAPVIADGTIGGPFTLVDETGTTVTSEQIIDRPTLLYFGYTFCPDICPVDLSRNAIAVDILEENGFQVRPVFASVDPARDTPEVLSEYTASMHPQMIGLTGNEEQVAAAAKSYGVYFKANTDDGKYYLVDHTTLTYLVLPDKGTVTFFRSDDSAERVAETVGCLLG